MYNVQVPPLVRVFKCAMAPSSSELSWETVAGLLRIKSSQANWNPILKPSPTRTARSCELSSFCMLKMYTEYVEEMNDEAGKLPQLSNLLVDALHTYSRKGFCIIPLMEGQEYKSDYIVAVVEVSYYVTSCVERSAVTDVGRERGQFHAPAIPCHAKHGIVFVVVTENTWQGSVCVLVCGSCICYFVVSRVNVRIKEGM